ncbi:hypothetical protein [Terrabacter carboxydivorans]|uniref:Lipoprotein n=1 Tax=Terrabacter carboxydivorans TaxID=619730 RepID=A0ABN3LMM8_9MICO
MRSDESVSPGRSESGRPRRRLRRLASALAALATGAVTVTGVAACTSGASAPRPTVEGPSMTSVPDGTTVRLTELEMPPSSAAEVARLLVRDADGLFWSGSKEPGRPFPARAGGRYRLTGRCLPATAPGLLVVDLLGPDEPGAVDGAPSQPQTGKRVATVRIPCDGNATHLDLEAVPDGSGALSVAEATSQVATGWVVLTRTS